jgi:signal transduction histidine kinase
MLPLFSRLSVKITLGILSAIILLAAVTGYLVWQGFQTAQEAAVASSAAGLRSQAHTALHTLVVSEANVIAVRLPSTTTAPEAMAQLESLKPAPGGYAFLVDRDGRLIAASAASLDLTTTTDPALRAAMADMRRGQNGLAEVVLNSRFMLMAYAPVPDRDWSLALVVPVEAAISQSAAVAAAIYTDGRQTVRRVLWSAVIVFGLALVGATLLSRRLLTRPLAELVHSVRAIGAGDLEARIPVTTQDEVGVLADSINQMAAELKQRNEESLLLASSQRRAEQFRALNEAGRHITALLSEAELLLQTQNVIRENFGYYFISIGLVEGENLIIRTDCDCGRTHLKVGEEGAMGWVAAHGRSLLIPDAAQDPRFIPAVSGARTLSELALPIQLKDRLIGVLNIESDQRDAFGADDIIVLQALANQLAVALENARLYEQAHQLAALEERQKLARELHDSVSQALYGIALGTRTARTLLDRDPNRAAEPLDYIVSLAEAGLAEMRALIFELRPESLQSEGLTVALSKQAEAARARYQLDVITDFCPEPETSLEIKEALYRVVQEALHNVAKHARANRVELRLENGNGRLTLSIRDDGQGFDPTGEFPGHLGLRSMRERVEAIGGAFRLESAPGQGTFIQAQIGSISSD